MSKKIDVLLLEDIDDLGRAGDIVAVAEGFARNNLFPEGKAALADAGTKKDKAQKDEQAAQKQQKHLSDLQEQADKLDGTELTIEARIKEGDEIFGSVNAATISKELEAQAGIKIKAKDIQLPDAITKTGSADITISLGEDIETTIRVTILPDPTQEAGSDEE